MWKFLGWTCVALGAIGVVLPIMPTVPFLLLATYCFERGSPKLHRWLLEHPTLGPPIRQWREHRVIRPYAKVMSVGCITLSVSYVLFFRDFHPWIKVGVAGSCAAVVVFILMQRNYPPPSGEPNGL